MVASLWRPGTLRCSSLPRCCWPPPRRRLQAGALTVNRGAAGCAPPKRPVSSVERCCPRASGPFLGRPSAALAEAMPWTTTGGITPDDALGSLGGAVRLLSGRPGRGSTVSITAACRRAPAEEKCRAPQAAEHRRPAGGCHTRQVWTTLRPGGRCPDDAARIGGLPAAAQKGALETVSCPTVADVESILWSSLGGEDGKEW